MTHTSKKRDKPNDPPYAGGEDETVRNPQIPDDANRGKEFPVDETDDGPGAVSVETGGGSQPEIPKVGSRDAPGG